MFLQLVAWAQIHLHESRRKHNLRARLGRKDYVAERALPKPSLHLPSQRRRNARTGRKPRKGETHCMFCSKKALLQAVLRSTAKGSKVTQVLERIYALSAPNAEIALQKIQACWQRSRRPVLCEVGLLKASKSWQRLFSHPGSLHKEDVALHLPELHFFPS